MFTMNDCETIDDDGAETCLCDDCLATWVDVFTCEVALADAVAAAIAGMEAGLS